MPISRRVLRTLIVAALTGVGACAEHHSLPTAADRPISASASHSWYNPEQNLAVERLARALAEGLEQPAARVALLYALRESPLTEHKVVLSEFLHSALGRQLVQAVAERSGISVRGLYDLVVSLPPIDLYVPYRAHRRSWRASEPMAVAALTDQTSPVFAHLPGGARLFIDRGSRAPNATAVLLLGPAEQKQVRRDARRLRTTADVIEDPRSDQRALFLTPDGCSPEDPECTCPPDADLCDGPPPGGGGSPAPYPFLWLERLVTNGVCDNGFCGEGNEFEMRGYDALSQVSGIWRCTEIASTDDVYVPLECPSYLIHESAPSEVAYIDVHVVETDGISEDDRWLDYVTPPAGFFSHHARVTNNASRSAAFLLYKAPGGLNCYPPNPDGNPDCSRVEVLYKW